MRCHEEEFENPMRGILFVTRDHRNGRTMDVSASYRVHKIFARGAPMNTMAVNITRSVQLYARAVPMAAFSRLFSHTDRPVPSMLLVTYKEITKNYYINIDSNDLLGSHVHFFQGCHAGVF